MGAKIDQKSIQKWSPRWNASWHRFLTHFNGFWEPSWEAKWTKNRSKKALEKGFKKETIFDWFWNFFGGGCQGRAISGRGLSDPLKTKHHWNWARAWARASTSTRAWACAGQLTAPSDHLCSYLAGQRRVCLGSWDGIHGLYTALQGAVTGFRISVASLVTATCM